MAARDTQPACQRRRWGPSAQRQPRAHLVDERVEIAEVILDHVAHDTGVYAGVAVHEDVSEPRHLPEAGRQGDVDPTVAREQIEQLAVGRRLAQALVGHHVAGDVQGRLDRDLQGVLDEPALAEIPLDLRRVGFGAQLAEVGPDEPELLGDEVSLRHRTGTGRRR
jgi:hypothetical protein